MRKGYKALIIIVVSFIITLCNLKIFACDYKNNEINLLSNGKTIEIESFIKKSMYNGLIPVVSIVIVKCNKITKYIPCLYFNSKGLFNCPHEYVCHQGNFSNCSPFIVFDVKTRLGVDVLSNLNSNYIKNIGIGVNKIIQGQYIGKDYIHTNNFSKHVNSVAVIVICFLIVAILATLIFITIILKKIMSRKIYIEINYFRKNTRFILSFVFMIIFSYYIHQAPYILFKGISWKLIFLWQSKNIRVTVYGIYVIVWLIYLYILLINYYKKHVKV